ncbi:hypothetical protein ADIWIN_1787 [Winogradskyella psychrotolerans RS-3]|uniref:Uncharacterized protein n=1 Tax=Winogradskyella psychrotolerans RS-3 TaxID=641526 RepID=S7VTG3_9FLAO|nr:hypothetical protein ADIWIN_1787 [Winogradskyella psychrotolerans RS-3]
MYPFCIGFPGCVYLISIKFFLHQFINVFEINSGPLSHLTYLGTPISSFRHSRVSTTALAGYDSPASIASASRLQSSITLKTLSFLPSVRASLIKSILQHTLSSSGVSKGCFTRLTKRFLCLRLKPSFISRYTRSTRFLFHFKPSRRILW